MKNEILEIIQNYTGTRELIDLRIEVPARLFNLSEGLENGYEDILEDEKVVVNAIGYDDRDRDNYTLFITIKEDEDTSKELLLLEAKLLIDKEIFLQLSYQKARKLILDMIVEGAAHSVNLITER
ncbi:MAG: hypothetical protein WC667_04880 [Sulfurimonas sp.]|jgi:hypothetical protein